MQVSMRYRKYGFKIFSVPKRMLWRCCTTCPISRKCGAAALDRHWSVVRTNQAAPRFFGSFVDLEARPKPRNLLVLMFDPAGMRPFVEEWEKVAAGLLQRVRREAVGQVVDTELQGLLKRLREYP